LSHKAEDQLVVCEECGLVIDVLVIEYMSDDEFEEMLRSIRRKILEKGECSHHRLPGDR